MILESALVRNARVLAMESPASFDPRRVNVVYGPNGSGKSTFFEMMRHAFLTNYNSAAACISALQPWNTQNAPYVELVFEHAGRRYRLEKRFASKAFAKLKVEESTGIWRDVENARGADDKLREFVRSSSVQDQGLFSALWSPQSELALVGLGNNVLEDVRSFLGAQVSGVVGAAIEKRIDAEWQKYLTEKGRPRKGSPITPLEERLSMAQPNASRAQEALRKIEQYAVAGCAARKKLAETDLRLAEVLAELEPLAAMEGKYRDLEARVEIEEGRKREAQNRYQAACETLDRIEKLRVRIQQIRNELPTLETEAARANDRWKECVKEESRCQTALAGLAAMEQEVSASEARRDRAARWLELRAALEKIAVRLREIADLEKTRTETAARLAALNAPDDKTLDAIRGKHRDLELLRGRYGALALRMQLSLEPGIGYEISKGVASAVDTITGIGEIGIRIARVGTIRVTGPAEGAQELASRIEEAAQKLSALCAPFGTEKMESLESRAQERRRLETELTQLAFGVAALLEKRPENAWRAELAETEKQLARLHEQEPSWEQEAPELGCLRDHAATLRQNLARARQQTLEDDRAARQALSTAAEAKNQADADLRQQKDAAGSLSHQLAEAEADGLGLDDRRESVAKFRRLAESAEETCKCTRQELGGFDPDFAARLEKLRRNRDELDERRESLRFDIRDADASQRALLVQSSWSDLTRAEEEIAELRRQIEGHTKEREAIRLLHDTLEQYREDALRDLPGPVAENVTKIIEEFAGHPMGRIALDNEFLPQSLMPVHCDAEQPIGSFSGGEQEQIHLALRFALADQCAAQERQVFVLDDVLLNTDECRLLRIFKAIERRRETLQFIILTCHPERYRPLDDVNWIPLGQTMSAAV